MVCAQHFKFAALHTMLAAALPVSPLTSPPPHPIPSAPQRLHLRHRSRSRVDGRDRVKDGCMPVDIDAGFEVAPGDAGEIEVAIAPFFLSVKT